MSNFAPVRVYLAGPDVFKLDAIKRGERMKATLAEEGLEGVFPLDGTLPPTLKGREAAIWIREHNMAAIRSCRAIIANMTPFRGASMDPGTADEMGVGSAWDMPMVGWLEKPASSYRRRVPCYEREDGSLLARDGMLVENFGLQDNLMMACAVISIENSLVAAARKLRDFLGKGA